ncbi:MAG TPA: aminoglycoside phosphotransferase [Jiangellaceae bacterium]|nr:aminoglycoside phosphotransferase [Jiangellaceae bacterium]
MTAAGPPAGAADPVVAGVVALLPEWLPEQRWFAGKGSEISAVRPVSASCLSVSEPERGPSVWDLLVEVDQPAADATVRTDVYQVPVSVHAEPQTRLEHALLGALSDGRLAYDALHDKDATAELLHRFSSSAGGSSGSSPIAFELVPHAELPLGESGVVMTAEQSNTSVIFGGEVLLKVFRQLRPGLNPDIEVHHALTEIGSPGIAELLGWMTFTSPPDKSPQDVSPQHEERSRQFSLAMLQTFLASATDGWALATASVRDLYAEADLHADEVGGDFAAEAFRLGAATGGVHTALAQALPTARLDEPQVMALTDRIAARIRRGLEQVPALAPYADALLAAVREPAGAELDVQRVHGDLHLGQVLRTVDGWKLVDFEGEPAAPVAERVMLDSPTRDVAGVLRSLDYAATHLQLVDHADDDQIAYRAREWVTRNQDAFCDGYASVSGTDPRAQAALLRMYEIDKAVYEVAYEARHRPGWLTIPMSAIERLLA